jgi:hypothetical protein
VVVPHLRLTLLAQNIHRKAHFGGRGVSRS